MAGAIKNSKVPIKISNIAAVSFVHQRTDFERRHGNCAPCQNVAEYCAKCLWPSQNIFTLLINVTFVYEFTEVYSKYLQILFSFGPHL